MDNVYIVMPAYNESENIDTIVNQWYPVVEKIGNASRLIIVDDGSTDSTFEKINVLKTGKPLLIPVKKENSGHGNTCLFAYKYAIQNQADFIFQTDSDGQTDPLDFWPFWEIRHEYEFVVGSRKKRRDGIGRIFVAMVLKLFLFVMTGLFIEDANTPFRLMKKECLKKYVDCIPDKFFLVNVLIACFFVAKKDRYKWMPIGFNCRQAGKNSVNFRKIFKIGFKAIRDFRIAKKLLFSNNNNTGGAEVAP